MDLLPLFKASVQAYKLCTGEHERRGVIPDRVFTKDVCQFTVQAKQIVKDIVQLRDFLLSHRKQYVNIDHWLEGACLMTDYERDRIDTQSQALIKTCQYVLSNLAKAVNMDKCSHQVQMHREAVIEIVTDFLKAVTKIYSEQRAIRVQRSLEGRKLLRLENLVAFTARYVPMVENDVVADHGDPDSDVDSVRATASAPYTAADHKNRPAAAPAGVEDFTRPQHNENAIRRRKTLHGGIDKSVIKDKSQQHFLQAIQKAMRQKADAAKLAVIEADVEHTKEEWTKIRDDIKPKERMQLEIESKELREEFTAKIDEIQRLEGKVVEIARLQDVFTEKVLQQEQDIYRVNDVAIHSTENIKAGNESIREAMKKKAGMRVYVIFFLIVMSFTLLFLDWYNP